jgi:hypothetical protein
MSCPTVRRALGSASLAIRFGSSRTSLRPVARCRVRPSCDPTRPTRYESTCSFATSPSSPRIWSSVRPVTSSAMMSGSGNDGSDVNVVCVSPGSPITASVMSKLLTCVVSWRSNDGTMRRSSRNVTVAVQPGIGARSAGSRRPRAPSSCP